jgi:hypothetical protein
MAAKTKKTQTSEVLKYLGKHKKGITSMQAFELFGVTRLASIVHELRRKYDIDTIMEDGKNRYGGIMQYARYVLKGELKEN